MIIWYMYCNLFRDHAKRPLLGDWEVVGGGGSSGFWGQFEPFHQWVLKHSTGSARILSFFSSTCVSTLKTHTIIMTGKGETISPFKPHTTNAEHPTKHLVSRGRLDMRGSYYFLFIFFTSHSIIAWNCWHSPHNQTESCSYDRKNIEYLLLL